MGAPIVEKWKKWTSSVCWFYEWNYLLKDIKIFFYFLNYIIFTSSLVLVPILVPLFLYITFMCDWKLPFSSLWGTQVRISPRGRGMCKWMSLWWFCTINIHLMCFEISLIIQFLCWLTSKFYVAGFYFGYPIPCRGTALWNYICLYLPLYNQGSFPGV